MHKAQAEIDQAAKRFNVISCGRRFGKTLYGERKAMEIAAQGKPAAWLAPNYKLLLEVWRDLTILLRPHSQRINVQERRIELPNGGLIEMWSLDSDTIGIGRKYARVIIDEAARAPNLRDQWQESIRPTLTDYAGDAFFMSTPKGKNYFWELWQRGASGTDDYASFRMPTARNPYVVKTEIDAARRELPDLIYRQEYEAEFLEDGAGVFQNVRQCATAEVIPPQAGRNYVGGVDWGRTNDATWLIIIDAESRRMVYSERMTDTEYTRQRARIALAAKQYNDAYLLCESNAMGLPNVEALREGGVSAEAFTTNNSTKAQIIDALALAFERGDISIIPDETLIAELQAYESERLPSGLVRYGAPPGLHDDGVIALALAWHAASNSGASAVLI